MWVQRNHPQKIATEIENKKYLFKLIIKKTNKIKQNFEAFIKKKKNYFREGIEKKKRK
jgi:hypothetical protein